jgi:predicted secreted protein
MENIETKYIILGSVLLAVFVFFNLSTVIWWGVLVLLAYLYYQSRKQNANTDINLDQLCAANPKLELCRIYLESQHNHKKIVDKINSRLSSDSGN